MTAILDRDIIAAAHGAEGAVRPAGRRVAGAPDRRGATRARGVSPRLSDSRAATGSKESITVSNEESRGAVRTAVGPVRVTGARGSVARSVERPRVRAAVRAPRGHSRAGACARRTARPTLAVCVLFAVGAFTGLLVLFGGSSQAEAPAAAPAHPALTSVVTVRAGQSLEQIAHEIAPGRAPSAVAQEIARINGLQNGAVQPGQTLVTPRY